jgi:hypothetical protein
LIEQGSIEKYPLNLTKTGRHNPNQTFEVRSRDPWFESNLLKSGFMLHDPNRTFWSPESWSMILIEPYEVRIHVPRSKSNLLKSEVVIHDFDRTLWSPKSCSTIRIKPFEVRIHGHDLSLIPGVAKEIHSFPNLLDVQPLKKINTKKFVFFLFQTRFGQPLDQRISSTRNESKVKLFWNCQQVHICLTYYRLL